MNMLEKCPCSFGAIFGIFVLCMLALGVENAFAAFPTRQVPATLHVPSGLGFGPGIARSKILDGARAKGGEAAYREALNALDVERSLVIQGDLKNGDSYIEFGNEKVTGENNIEQKIQQWADEKGAAQSQKPQEQQKQGEVLVVETKYTYVGPGLGQYGPSDELVLHNEKLSDGQPISDSKQQVLAINSGTGRGNVVDLGSILVGGGPYRVQQNCQDNRGAGAPKLIRLPRLDENSFEACKDTSGQNQQGGNNQGNLNQGGLGGFESILPLLMQGLMGGGAGGGRGGYGAEQGYSPYGNQYNQYNQQHPSTGSGQSTPTPNIAAISSTIVNQLNASGVPAAILEQVRNTVTSVLGGVLNGGVGTSETIIE